MSIKIPLVSSIIQGLMSQEDKIKLDGIFSSTSGLFLNQISASVGQFGQLSGAFISGSSLHITDLVVINSNLTGTASVPDPLSSSIQRSHQLSASYFSMSSGSANILSATTLTVRDLIVLNSNITGSGGSDPFSASVIRAHNLSGSYFEFISGNVNRLTATSISSTLDVQGLKFTASFMTASTGTYHNVTASYITGTEIKARTGSFSIEISHIMTATNFSASSGSIDVLTSAFLNNTRLTSTSISSTLDVQTLKFTASFITGTTGTLDVVTASYLTGTEIKARTGSFSIEISHIMTATNFTASSGSIHVVTASYITGTELLARTGSFSIGINNILTATNMSASSGSIHVATASYVKITDLVVTNSNITSTIPSLLTASSISSTIDVTTTKFTASFMTASTGTFFIVSASYAEYNKFTASSLSSTIDVQTNKFTASFLTASTGTFFILSSSYESTVKLTASSGISSTIDIQTNKFTASFITGTTGTFDIVTASYITGTESRFRTSSFSIGITNILTATNMSASSGSIDVLTAAFLNNTRLTSTSISSTLDLQSLKLTASFVTGTTGTFDLMTASYLTGTEIKARTGSFSIEISHIMTATNFSASSGSIHVATASYLRVTDLVATNTNITASIPSLLTASSISSTIDVTTTKFTASFMTGATGTFFVQSASYSSATYLTVQNLVVINSNLTGTASTPDPLSSSVQRTHQFSASYFSMSSGSINILKIINGTADNFQATNLQIVSTLETNDINTSGGPLTIHADNGLDSLILDASDVSVGTIFSASTGTFHVVTASYFTATDVDTLMLSASYLTATNANIHQLSASYISATYISCTNMLHADSIYGDGFDVGGVTVTISTPTTLANTVNNKYYYNLTIQGAGSLVLAQNIIYVKNNLDLTLANTGSITGRATKGLNASGLTAGSFAAITSLSTCDIGSAGNGGSGGNGGTTVGSAANAGTGLVYGAGGGGGRGGRGGTGTIGLGGALAVGGAITQVSYVRTYSNKFMRGITILSGGCGGAGGSGGGGNGTNQGGGGGGGGSGNFFGIIFAKNVLVSSFTSASCISFTGGLGGNGANGTAGTGTAGGGGGGGGGGGHIYFCYATKSGPVITNFFDVSGGDGGNGGNNQPQTGTNLGGQGGYGGWAGSIFVLNTTSGSGSFYSSSQVLSQPANPTAGTGSVGATGTALKIDF